MNVINQERERAVAEKMRREYSNHEETDLEKLQKLDGKVKRPAKIFSYIFGVIGSLVLGTGMCLAMKIIGNLMPLGIVVGMVGIGMVSANYFIYRALSKSRKAKYAGQIIEMSDRMLHE